MCKKKPGLRCSPHAKAFLDKARSGGDLVAIAEAEREWQMTPEGLKELRASGDADTLRDVLAEKKKRDAAYKAVVAADKEAARARDVRPATVSAVEPSPAAVVPVIPASLMAKPAPVDTVPEHAEPAVEAPRLTQLLDYVREHHMAPVADDDVAPAHDLTYLFPKDVYDHPESYTAFPDKELLSQLKKARGNPDATITIYRALETEHGHINGGDWVALSEEYANYHLQSILKRRLHLDGARDYHVIKAEVPAHTLWCEGNDLAEWGYDGDVLDTRASA